MSKGTRIVLAFSVLFVGVLVAYYGFILKDDRSLNVDNRRLVDPTLEPAGASNSPGEEETGRDSADEGIAAAVVEWGDGDPSRAAAAGDGLVEERHLGEFESRPSAAAAVTGGAPQEALTDGSEPNGEEERTGLDPLPPAVTALEMGASPQPGTTAHDLLAAVGAVTSSPEDQPLLDERATPTSVGTSGQGAQAPDAAPRETPSAPEPATLGLLAIGALAVIRRRRKA